MKNYTKQEIDKIYNNDSKEESFIFRGNPLPTNFEDAFNKKKVFLDPGKIISDKTSTYFVLRLKIQNNPTPFIINADSPLTIKTQNNTNTIKALYSINDENETIAYYKIDAWKLINISNSDSVKIYVEGKNGWITGSFNDTNIKNYKFFVKHYVYDIENKIEENSTKRGFVGIGGGKNKEIWISAFSKNDNKMFFSGVGVGYSNFKYKRYRLSGFTTSPPILTRYTYLDSKKNDVFMVGTMFGVKYNHRTVPWSFQVSGTLSYYFLRNKNWNEDIKYKTEIGDIIKIKYAFVDGNDAEGIAVGMALQVGVFWFRVDTENSWTTGISIPVNY